MRARERDRHWQDAQPQHPALCRRDLCVAAARGERAGLYRYRNSAIQCRSKGRIPQYGPEGTDWTKYIMACLLVLSTGRTLSEPAWKVFLEGVAKGLILGHPEHWLGRAPIAADTDEAGHAFQ
jgi:hypothetical protein